MANITALTPGTWNVDVSHSTVGFVARHLMVTKVRGRFTSLDLEFDGVATDPWGNTKAGFSASTDISRKEFGLDWNVALEAGGVLVGDKIKIELDIQAVRA